MEFTRSNHKDIERYFFGTWVKFEEFGDQLFFVLRVRHDHIAGVTDDGTDFILELYDDQPYIVNYVLPHKAVFQYGNRAAIIRRIPAKQYRRGLCADNTQVFYPDTQTPVELSKAVLLAYTNKQSYCSLSDAFNTKGDKRTSTALSPRMWAARKTGYIYIDTTPVAFYNRENNNIQILKLLFVPEIKRHLVAFNDNLEIV